MEETAYVVLSSQANNFYLSVKVAFHRDIRVTSVTLEGDIFQPTGLLTGGSRKYDRLVCQQHVF